MVVPCRRGGSTVTPPIRIAVAVARNASGEILLVRMRDTTGFKLAGGKIDSGSSAAQSACSQVGEARSRATSRAGGAPKVRLYSRLN